MRDYRLYALLSPHLSNFGKGNTGWIDSYKGRPMFFAQREFAALALASSAPWLKRSVGFVGYSDGWQDLSQHFQMEWEYDRAENGNIALTAEIDLAAHTTANLFSRSALATSGPRPANRPSLPFSPPTKRFADDYCFHWRHWQKSLKKLDAVPRDKDLYRASAAVLRAHESKDFLGGIIANLSIPWGFNKGDEDLGGYHLVWPRDLVENLCCA